MEFKINVQKAASQAPDDIHRHRDTQLFLMRAESIGENISQLLPGHGNLIKSRREHRSASEIERKNTMVKDEQQVSRNQGKIDELKAQVSDLIKTNDAALMQTAMVAIFLAIIDNDLYYDNKYETDDKILYVRVLVMIFSLAWVIWIKRRYDLLLMQKMLNNQIWAVDTIWSTRLYRYMLLECLFWILHCPPGLEHEYEVEQLHFTIRYSIHDLLTMGSTLKWYTIIRWLGNLSMFASNRAKIVQEVNGITTPVIFALKAIFKTQALTFIVFQFLICTFLLSFHLFLAERNAVDSDGLEIGLYFKYYWDALWWTQCTQTTVGFGDMVPQTHYGRLIAMLNSLAGSSFISLLILAIEQNLYHTQEESFAYKKILRERAFHEHKIISAMMIQRIWRKYWLRHKNIRRRQQNKILPMSESMANLSTTIGKNSTIKRKLLGLLYGVCIRSLVFRKKSILRKLQKKSENLRHNLQELQEKFLVPVKDIIENQKQIIDNPTTLIEMSSVIGNDRYIEGLAQQVRRNSIKLQKLHRRRKSSLPGAPMEIQEIDSDLSVLKYSKSNMIDDIVERAVEASLEFKRESLRQVQDTVQPQMSLLSVPVQRQSNREQQIPKPSRSSSRQAAGDTNTPPSSHQNHPRSRSSSRQSAKPANTPPSFSQQKAASIYGNIK